jgi:TorA maturation chaperone TorD
VPAYETEYGGDGLFLQSHELADIGGFYAAVGLDLAPGERADHVSAECEFLMFLARKEALALERHEPDTLAAVQRAARLFVRDHLGRFVPALAARLERADRDGFYGVLGALSAAFIGRECQRLDVPPGAPALPLRPTADDGVPMACGTCGVGAAADGD